MKSYIIALLIVLALSCWLNDSGSYQPSEMKAGIKEITMGSGEPVSRDDFYLPESKVTDGARTPTFSNQVVDTKGFGSSDFPLAAHE
jgi:hypothetical protein